MLGGYNGLMATSPPLPPRGTSDSPKGGRQHQLELLSPHKYESALGWVRHLLFGRPLPTSRADEQKLPIGMALPILSSNALSSNAYATEAILAILILAKAGPGAFSYSVPIAVAICALLLIVTISYIQIIYAYPEGGGAYPVSRDNLNPAASLVAGASLMVDYLLTVAVSVAAGVAAIIAMLAGTAAGTLLQAHIVPLCLISIVALTIANVRGLRESGLLFAVPTYVFIVGILATVVAGLFAHAGPASPALTPANAVHQASDGMRAIGWILLLQAFSQGCAALTGMEAISSTVPVFRHPSDRNAALTMYVMSGLAVVMFLGLTYVANKIGMPYLHPQDFDASRPGYQSVVAVVADRAWPHALHFMFYVVQISTALVLLLAANTAFAGFPQLTSMMARDSYLPRQLAAIGDRLAYNNGIIVLALVASLLIIIFNGLVDALLPMYAIGVFIGFTLAQAGMVRRWNRLRTPGWQRSMISNALGALATGLVVLIIAVSKFATGDRISKAFHFGPYYPHYGVWIVLALVPVMVITFLKIHQHYATLAQELSLERPVAAMPSHNTVLVLVSRLHRGIVDALNYAEMISDDVRGISIESNPDGTPILKRDWEKWAGDIPLVIMESPYRSLLGPLLRYIDAVQRERSDDVVTIIIPELVSRKWWHRLLHNQAGPLIRFALAARRDVYVVSARYFLEQ
jgi:amino acid transporter